MDDWVIIDQETKIDGPGKSKNTTKFTNQMSISNANANDNANTDTNPKHLEKVEINFTIDWVRHAESCSNYDQNDYLDRTDIRKIPSLDMTKLKAASVYHPNLSFIGLQQAIMLGTTSQIKNTKYDAIFVSPTMRTIMTALMAFRGTTYTICVIPYITEHINLAGKYDFQNTPVDTIRLKRMVSYVKDWMEENWIKYFDDVLTIKTLTDLKEILINNNLRGSEVIESLLLCKQNMDDKTYNDRSFFGSFMNKDKYLSTAKQTFCQSAKSSSVSDICYDLWYKDCIDDIFGKLKALRRIIKDQIPNYPQLQIYNDYFSQLTNKSYIRGPDVDFTYMEQYQSHNPNPTNGSGEKQYMIFNKFYTNFLPNFYFNNRENLKPSYNILCVSHGGIMREYFRINMPHTTPPDKYNMLNTRTFRETFVLVDYVDNYFAIKNRNINYNYYIPGKIREKYLHLEDQNIDICRTQSLKGMLNYPLWSLEEKNNFVPLSNAIFNMFDDIIPQPKQNMLTTPDSQFIFGKNGNIPPNLKYYNDEYKKTIIVGGNEISDKNSSEYKYHKYKSKYLNLIKS